jgi:hypothetical protein
MESRQRHGRVPALGGADDAVAVGSQTLVGGEPGGSSSARTFSHCLLPSCSQLVYMLHAPPAGAATEMPVPASVLKAPAPTQLLTSGPALNASSRMTACGPPRLKATGMSRPMAADGTINISTVAAVAWGADNRLTAVTATRSVRSAITPRLI